MGIALNLEEDTVGCVLLGPDEEIAEGDEAHTTGLIAQTKVGARIISIDWCAPTMPRTRSR